MVAAVGAGVVPALISGTPVAAMVYGGFSEYQVVPAKLCMEVPRPSPEVLALLTSGQWDPVAGDASSTDRMGVSPWGQLAQHALGVPRKPQRALRDVCSTCPPSPQG